MRRVLLLALLTFASLLLVILLTPHLGPQASGLTRVTAAGAFLGLGGGAAYLLQALLDAFNPSTSQTDPST